MSQKALTIDKQKFINKRCPPRWWRGAQVCGGPLGSSPSSRDHDAKYRQHLAEQHTGPVYAGLRFSPASCDEDVPHSQENRCRDQCRSKADIAVKMAEKAGMLEGA